MTPADVPGLLSLLASLILLAVVLYLNREVDRRTRLVRALADRTHAQAELLAKRAERPQ